MSVDLSASITRQIGGFVRRAEAARDRGALLEGVFFYRIAAGLCRRLVGRSGAAMGEQTHRMRASRYQRLAAGLELAARVQPQTAGAEPWSCAHSESVSSRRQDARRSDDILDTEALRERVKSMVRRSSVSWEDIGGLEEIKEEIQASLALTLAVPPPGVKIPRNQMMLMEGPPGTGKTLLASAVAGHVGATFYDVKTSQLMSRYFGDSERMVSLLFEEARANAPAVIFLDEVDGIASARTGNESGPERRILTTLLSELEGVVDVEDSLPVMVLAATNKPNLLDDALLSRCSRRIRMPLPDRAARAAILRIHIGRAGYDSLVPIEKIAGETQGCSGRDLQQLCLVAVRTMLWRANPQLRDISRTGEQQDQVQHGQNSEAAKDLHAKELTVLPLTQEDFDRALRGAR
ncbi:ATP-binding protein [Candidatus Eisenbacteria bacterium]|uniref:ATP-binding protein n=1 Tax=Eiseniibacteriota bacterium TaxID=2212470 RepID=A0ABV6YLJ1_UNCEI